MHVKALTQNRMESGRRFAELLIDEDLSPKAAFWIYNSELKDWQLVLGHVNGIGDDVEAFSGKVAGILDAYETQLPELQVGDVSLALRDAPILELLNSVVNTGEELLGINFSNEEINGIVIDGVYLYRMNITAFA